MPVYPRAFHFPVSRHSLNENPLLCFAQCPSEVIRRFKCWGCCRDKTRSSRKNQASSSSGGGGGEGNQDGITDEEALSNITKQKAAAAKQYIENHYKEQMKNLQDRKERYKNEPSIMKYIKIAATLPDKTVRDVALRCWWMQAHA
ncbi:hypothetical protein ERO13_D03G104600v2 [Gossypium hirsutum]|uniref:Uncharacterized protein isoform X1 n=4 Tax=Gossypium TaxID=3633 RepID=A0ABM2ZTV1_GOSHI|nr:uncharacterized protein LOC107949694 isoform X1 [Gossypium hirsutum]KAB2038143.1 hypothetical protein ES319_D03G125100v1 [Gossypium barbadense]KAG4155314.1 hypothetical protein ERO13_D03G104600v2 [Gossypium hirsutum]TYG76707.1 hypothetical protein ES288_D03G135100v1 [Gossypium darwinii]TYI90400.1 hypothetical protein E1A91_D03G119400v1 [Gossypium mustelinum]